MSLEKIKREIEELGVPIELGEELVQRDGDAIAMLASIELTYLVHDFTCSCSRGTIWIATALYALGYKRGIEQGKTAKSWADFLNLPVSDDEEDEDEQA